jgi:hypothetical protein
MGEGALSEPTPRMLVVSFCLSASGRRVVCGRGLEKTAAPQDLNISLTTSPDQKSANSNVKLQNI